MKSFIACITGYAIGMGVSAADAGTAVAAVLHMIAAIFFGLVWASTDKHDALDAKAKAEEQQG